MKRLKKALALVLALAAIICMPVHASAAQESNSYGIDFSKTASVDIYKYDLTSAEKDGVWNSSYVSTGVRDEDGIESILGNTQIVNQLTGNGESCGYAIKGVEFSYIKVADIEPYNGASDNEFSTDLLYGFKSGTQTSKFLEAIGLSENDRYAAADKEVDGAIVFYFHSDTLVDALKNALTNNATSVKNALETYVRENGGTAMPETDGYGHSAVSDLPLGLYLFVETRVPENVTSTCNPFFVSLPMTTVDGGEWIYDIVTYPKNQTGNPDLSKTVREAKNSTGKHNGSLTDISDGYAHTATASVGDTVDYQIISTLPTITSKASSLSEYTYVDTMSKGIRYNKNDVVIEFFKDAGCTDKITTWAEDSGKFTVAYDDAQNSMTIKMTESGLAEINEATTVYTDSVKRGFSDCTMRITYAATLTADAQMGDKDNPNEVVLTWKRTNTTYYDTLNDCCHVYTYGVDILKQFSDGKGSVQNVKFNLHNDTDNCYIIADLKDGIYYAKGFTSKKSDATTFVPNSSGHIIVKGLEDDAYSLTEIATDKGYILLKDAIELVIKTSENGACEKCGAKLLTASATVNGKDATMSDGNAIVSLTVLNNPGFDLPRTGGRGVWMYTVGGVLLLGSAAFIVIRSRKQHKSEQ